MSNCFKRQQKRSLSLGKMLSVNTFVHFRVTFFRRCSHSFAYIVSNCFHRNFDSLEKLANHVSMSHSQIGYNNLYYCKWEGCQRTARGFNARYKMLVHCRTHTKEKPHFCTFTGCIKAFSRAENLKIHYRSHTLEKPYRCCYPNCQKAYSNSSDRFKHSKTHMNNKPYCCKLKENYKMNET